MARAHQHVVLCRRVQQRIKAIANGTQNCHSFGFGLCVEQTPGNTPLVVVATCQSDIK